MLRRSEVDERPMQRTGRCNVEFFGEKGVDRMTELTLRGGAITDTPEVLIDDEAPQGKGRGELSDQERERRLSLKLNDGGRRAALRRGVIDDHMHHRVAERGRRLTKDCHEFGD